MGELWYVSSPEIIIALDGQVLNVCYLEVVWIGIEFFTLLEDLVLNHEIGWLSRLLDNLVGLLLERSHANFTKVISTATNREDY